MLQHMKVDVHCNWSDQPPVYRVYIDGDMMTERTFRWAGYQAFIRENIICDLESGIHTVRIDDCGSQARFRLENFELEGRTDVLHPNYTDPESKQITFIVR